MLDRLLQLLGSLSFPPTLTACGLVLAAVLGMLSWWRSALLIGVVAIGWTVIWSVPVTSDGLRSALESSYPPVDEATLPKSDAIIVLGGATSRRWARDPVPDADQIRPSRVGAAARTYLAGRAPVVILSGGRGEAEVMAAVMPKLGVPESALVLETRSHDTVENARYTARIVKEHGWSRLLLVTSSIHMRRALSAFREQGLNPVPVAATERWHVETGLARWMPSRRTLRRSNRTIRELAAFVGIYVDCVKPG